MRKTGVYLGICVSLSLLAAKVIAQGPVEKSSPEEFIENSPPGLGLLTPGSWATYQSALDSGPFTQALTKDPELEAMFRANPLTVSGVLPYRPDPISTFIGAAIILAIQSMQEKGSVDVDAIYELLNSTELYAGLLGSGTLAWTRWRSGQAITWAGKKVAPDMIKSISKYQLTKILNHIVGAVTYAVAVSGGYEYFTGFWKLSTQGVENVSTMTDLFAEFKNGNYKNSVYPVLENLKIYLLDPNTRSRVASSIYNHRILTYEFIAMNIALYVGMVAGDIIFQKLGPQNPVGRGAKIWRGLIDYFGRSMGGLVGGIMVQFTPKFIKVAVNESLLDYKVKKQREKLRLKIAQLRWNVQNAVYPSATNMTFQAASNIGLDFQSDVENVAAQYDLVNSLLMNELMLEDEDQEDALKAMIEVRGELMDSFSDLRSDVAREDWMNPTRDNTETLSAEELGRRMWRRDHRSEYQEHYSAILDASKDRMNLETGELINFVNHIVEFRARMAESQ